VSTEKNKMTHHITAKTLLDKVTGSRRTFENTRCSWCQTEANYWTSMSEDNFVPVEGKTLGKDQAFAVFCPECLKDPNRKKEVKYAVSIGEAEGAIPAQTPFRELSNKDREYKEVEGIPKNWEDLPEIELGGAGLQAPEDPERGEPIVNLPAEPEHQTEKGKKKEKKGLFER
jgi:hypothetical protein